jgi:hypothetical protein
MVEKKLFQNGGRAGMTFVKSAWISNRHYLSTFPFYVVSPWRASFNRHHYHGSQFTKPRSNPAGIDDGLPTVTAATTTEGSVTGRRECPADY